jgi:hypothetical protein
LLSALVRHPLSLADFNRDEMTRLPAGLFTTVLLSSPSTRALRDLALVAGPEPVQVLRHGDVQMLPACMAVVCSDEPAPLPAIRIHLMGQAVARFRAGYLQALEERRPALLRYRLTHFALIESSSCECQDFSPEVQRWAQVLGAAVAPFAGAAAEVVEALHPQDQEQQSSFADSTQATTIEALFLALHTSPSPYVQDVSRIMNLLLAGRGERELATRGVGALLRKLGFYSERTGAGYRLAISQRDRQRVHRLAHQMGVPLPAANPAACPFCADLSTECAGSGDDSHSPDDDLHNLHNQHDVHDVPSNSDVQAAELSAIEETR